MTRVTSVLNDVRFGENMLTLPRELIDVIFDESGLIEYNVLTRVCRSIVPPPGRFERTPIMSQGTVVAECSVTSQALPNGTKHGLSSVSDIPDQGVRSISAHIVFDRGQPRSWQVHSHGETTWGRIGSNVVVKYHVNHVNYIVTGFFAETILVACLIPGRATVYGEIRSPDGIKPVESPTLPPVCYHVDGVMDLDIVAEWFARWGLDNSIALTPIAPYNTYIPRQLRACLTIIAPELLPYVFDN